MGNRFVNREYTIREALWCAAASKGDFEAMILLLESRRVDRNWDFRDLTISEFQVLVDEMIAGVPNTDRVDQVSITVAMDDILGVLKKKK